MNNNLTEVVFILDRSGSMASLTDETIGGFNGMIEQQKADTAGEVMVTTVLFDNQYEILHDHVNIKEIQPMDGSQYYARGCTALLDAIGKTIDSVGERLAATPEEERPCNVIFIITTDGYENASIHFTQKDIKKKIEHQKSKYSWTFMFLGANIDAEQVGASYGINRGYSKTYTASKVGTDSVYRAMGQTVTLAKNYGARGISLSDCTEAMTSALNEVE